MPDFGIMRGFNEKLFGDKLVAGQLPTQLGLIGSTDFGFDADAQAFFDRVTAATGTLSNTEKLAVDTLVRQMKLDGIWSLMKAIYPMVGASAAACAQNLKSSSFTGSFFGGVTFASTGVTGNGATGYFDTAYNPVTQSDSQTSFYMSIYIRTNSNLGNAYDIGNGQALSVGAKFTGIITRYSSNRQYIAVADPYGTQNASTDSRGFYSGGTNGSAAQILYKNGTNVLSGTSAQQGFQSNNLWVMAANDADGFPTFSNKENAFASIGTGLSPTQNTDFYTAIQAFQTTLSRQV